MKSITRKKKTTGLKKRESLTGYLFVSPWIIGALMFLIIPLGQSFYYSLCNVKVSPKGRRYDFVDFKNYTDLFRLDVGFIENMLRYLLNTLISVPVLGVFALIIAMLLNNRMKGKGFFRTIYFYQLS